METKYRAEIDGLRTLAVGGVIVFHLDPHLLRGGFLGVDVFFVISGFLISSLVMRDLEGKGFSFRKFWARRAKRILPAMLAMTLTTMVAVWLFGFKGEHPRAGGQAAAALLSIANIYFWRNTGDYWGPGAESLALLHTWSLSVEEQFYLFFPLLLFLLFRYARKMLPFVLVILVLASLLLFFYGARMHPDAAFYLLPCRAWELGAGVLLACIKPLAQGYEFMKRMAAILGLLVICATYLFTAELIYGAPLAVLGTILFIWGGQHGIGFKLMSQSPLVYLGKLSYSLYLWHWPVIVLGRTLQEEPIPVWAVLPLTGLFAVGSYYLVEFPLRYAKTSLPYIMGATATAITLSVILFRSDGLYDTSELPVVTYHGFEYDLKPDNFESVIHQGPRATMILPTRTAPADAYRTGGVVVGDPTQPPEIVLTGDSHGVMWANTVRTVCEELGLNARLWCMDGVDSAFSVPPVENYGGKFVSQEDKYAFDEARYRMISQWHPRVIIVGTRWSIRHDLDTLQQTIAYFAQNADRVILIGQPPEMNFGQRFAVQMLAWKGAKRDDPWYSFSINANHQDRSVTVVRTLAEEHENVDVLETQDLYINPSGGGAMALADGQVLYYDDDHITEAGAQLAKGRFLEAIKRQVVDIDTAP